MISTRKLQKIIINTLSNLQFAIFLLIIIVLFGACGSILEQDQSSNFYLENYGQIKIFNFLPISTVILKSQLDHIFSTFWFYLLIFIFSLNLITCSFSRQFPIFIFSRSNRFFYSQNIPKTLQIYKTLNSTKTSILNLLLLRNNYLIFQKKNSFYSYKGLLGKFAPLLIHLSLIIVIIGSVIATLSSFSAQELISKSEITAIQNITRKNLFSKIPSYSLRVNDFWIDYSKNTSINQYFSDVSILDNLGNEDYRKTISVNHPLKYQGLAIYQTDWNLNALVIKLSNGIFKQIPLTALKNQKKTWIGNIVKNQEKCFFVVNNNDGLILIYNSKGQFDRIVEIGQTIDDFKIIYLISSTGLQLKLDPGIPLLYSGFFFLMVSIILNNQYFSELWISTIEKSNKSVFIGKTNRSVIRFNLEIFKTLRLTILES